MGLFGPLNTHKTDTNTASNHEAAEIDRRLDARTRSNDDTQEHVPQSGSGDRTGEHSPEKRAAFALRTQVCLAAFGSSLLMFLAFPPVNLWWFSFVIPVPLIWAADQVNRVASATSTRVRWQAALAATLGVMPLWMWEEQWVFMVSLVGSILLVIQLSLYAGAFVWLTSWIGDKLRWSVWLVGPVVWTALEFLRGDVLWHGYPWLLIGQPTIAFPALAQAGSVVGIYGVSLLTASIGAALGAIVLHRHRTRLMGVVSLAAVSILWLGLSRVPGVSIEDRTMHLGVVQTNVPQSIKMGWDAPSRVGDLDTMLALTQRASRATPKPDLIVWPETMYPGDALEPEAVNEERAAQLVWHTDLDTKWPKLSFVIWKGPDGIDTPIRYKGPFMLGNDALAIWTTVAADSVLAWQQRLGIPMIIGAVGYDDLRIKTDPQTGEIEPSWSKVTNSSYLITEGKVSSDRYDKMHLTPFGEVMPYISQWKWLERLFLRIGIGARGMSFELSAGTKPIVHIVPTDEAGLIRVATPICFEGVMPEVCRTLVYAGQERQADIMVQLTNEGWFGTFDTARAQHLQAVQWRAVELGVSVVRAANTGISALIDPRGQVVVAGVEGGRKSRVPGVLWADAPLTHGTTVFGRIGDILGLGSFIAAMLLVGAAAIVSVRQRPARRTADKKGK